MGHAVTKTRELRFLFVQMLFALAVAEIARRTVILLDARETSHMLPGFSHLLLAVIVVATSWVGWANSAWNQEWSINRVFSRNFLVLLVDVLLVILYFILISGAEKPDGQGNISPSAWPEAWPVVLIFIVYSIWDALTKVGKIAIRAYLKRTRITWVCTVLAVWVLCFCTRTTRELSVILTDCLLILIVLTFRVFKDKPRDQPWSVLDIVSLVLMFGLTFLWAFLPEG